MSKDKSFDEDITVGFFYEESIRQKMQLKQTIKEVFNEMDLCCHKCKCEGKDE